MANKFCRNISNSYRFNRNNKSELYYQPCCWVPNNYLITDKQSLIDAQTNMAPEIFKNVKANCDECFKRERTDYRISGRQEALNYIPADAIDGDPYVLEFQLDTNCNAACSICGPQFSSLWQKQLNIVPIKDATFKELHHQIINLISFDNVKQIKFFGGEPLLTDSHLTILEQVPNPAECEIMYSTNGSIFPNEKVLAVWRKFKKVKLSFSIDAIKDRFEYIRWPLKWSRVESNLINVAQTLSTIEVRLHCTVNPMNVLYVNELEQWIHDVQKTHNINIIHTFSPCFGVWGIDAVPPGLTEKISDQYPADHPVIKMLSAFKQVDEKYKYLLEDMINLDQSRNLNWRTTFPDTINYFKKLVK